ncbi:MAG: LysR substrate-binding domain-containing protein [Pseudomonadota bacterium]
MEFKRYRLFVTLAEELHFSRAAKRAGVTQSVLSVQIKRLEEELGVALLNRTTRAVRLTHAGRNFLFEARAVLDRVDESVRVARALAAGKEHVLRVGLTTVAAFSSAPEAIGRFREAHPEIEIQIREMGTVDQESALATNELDVAFLHPPLDHPDIAVLSRRPSRFFGLRRSPATDPARTLQSWRELLAEPLIFYGRRRAPRLYDEMISSAHALGVSPVIVAEASSFLSAVATAAAGVGTALVPVELTASPPPQTVVVEVPDCPLTLDNGIAYRSYDTNAALNELLDFLRRGPV